MKPRLLILSDLWGTRQSNWINMYTQILQPCFDIHYYDSCQLGQIDTTGYTENNLHAQFVSGGIEKAAMNLLQAERGPVDVLAFSVGGAIAWKAALQGLRVEQLIAVSSTRLRYETEKPSCAIQLYFGSKDAYKPSQEWLEERQVSYLIIDGEHQLYAQPEVAIMLARSLVDKKALPSKH